MRFDLKKGFPLITTKKIHFPSVVHELLWFLKGESNIEYLKNNNVRIWDEWADEKGDLGRIYGVQWRSWKDSDGQEIDQITHLMDSLRNNPDSRRHIVSAWNVGSPPEIPELTSSIGAPSAMNDPTVLISTFPKMVMHATIIIAINAEGTFLVCVLVANY